MSVRERPILFGTDMVRAILEGRKTQTRRPVDRRVRTREMCAADLDGLWHFEDSRAALFASCSRGGGLMCPFGVHGDRLWVREAWAIARGNGHRIVYRADHETHRWPPSVDPRSFEGAWRPSIHMKREHARLLLEVEWSGVERLDQITEQDAKAEGVVLGDEIPAVPGALTSDQVFQTTGHRSVFRRLWDETYSSRNRDCDWAKYPFVWVVKFKVLDVGDRWSGRSVSL